MRDLNECKAEIFRRGEKRIRERRAKITKTIAMCVPVFLLIAVLSVNIIRDIHKGVKMDMNTNFSGSGNFVGSSKPDDLPDNELHDGNGVAGMQSNGFSFNLTWGCYGISSYDSETGILVKTNDATNPEEYVTTYYLTEEEKKQIYNLITDLDMEKYPDEYNPHNDGVMSSPSMTLVLSVKNGDFQKTIMAEDIALTYECDNVKGQKFLYTCKMIQDILVETEEWKELPEYEFFYD